MKKKMIMWLAAALSALLVCTMAVSALPGDNSDPVVTKSYIDKVVEEIKAYVADAVGSKVDNGENNEKNESVVSSESAKYEIVNVKKGKKITFGESTEIILRAGNGTVFTTEQGGIADVTGGNDLTAGARVPLNHLLIVPRDDGRGFTTESDAVIMVRGSYNIE
ncbi:MAG: hypothetical protein IKW59_00445 [Clostridia bacterium]|nr:hypothetical protein [Clostridia bacterium]